MHLLFKFFASTNPSMTLDFQKTMVRTVLYQSVIKATKICANYQSCRLRCLRPEKGANEDDVVDGSEGSDGLMGEVHEARGLPGN